MSGSGTQKSPIVLDSDVSDSENPALAVEETSSEPNDHDIKEPSLLLGLPVELLKIVADPSNLSNVDRHSLKLTTHGLRKAEFKTTPLSKSDYLLFNKTLEAGVPSRHHLLASSLLCTNCLSILPKSAFPDAHAKRVCMPPRSCLQCSITNGHFNRLCFKLHGKMNFACGACKEVKPLSLLEDLDEDTELKLCQKFGAFRSVELKLKVRSRRWCKGCWRGISGFWAYAKETGKIKEAFGAGDGW